MPTFLHSLDEFRGLKIEKKPMVQIGSSGALGFQNKNILGSRSLALDGLAVRALVHPEVKFISYKDIFGAQVLQHQMN
jgi:hypothetical protein